jgi:thiol-disulfide isomerase/thioredoxin
VLPFAEDGQPFPNWSLKSMNGVDLNSEKFKGKVVIFDFWASYCGPCVNIATPNIHALQKSYPNDVVVVAINVDGALTQKKGLQLIDKWQGEGRYNLMFDGNSEQFALFGRALRGAPINGIPLVVVVDKDQTVRHIGSMLDKAEIDKVTGLLKPQQITQSTPSATPGR